MPDSSSMKYLYALWQQSTDFTAPRFIVFGIPVCYNDFAFSIGSKGEMYELIRIQ